MSTIRVKVNPEVIVDAVSKSNRNMAEVKVRYPSFEKWISRELEPTFNQLKELSRFLRIPFGYLLLNSPVVEDIPLLEFRTVETEAIQKPSRELIDTIQDMERKQAWLREFYIAEGRDKLDFVGSMKFNENVEYYEIAEEIRTVLGIDKQWFEEATSRRSTFDILRDRLSQNGIIIMQSGIALNNTHRALDIDEFRAFTLIDEFAPLIFINSRDSQNGKVFSLLHELVHLFFGSHSLYNDDFRFRNRYTNPLEILCNKVAGEIIAPTDLFIFFWEEEYDNLVDVDEKITAISAAFKVSRLVIARKALDRRYINRIKYNETAAIVRKEFELSRQRKKDSTTGGNVINNALSRLDRNFFQTLIYAVQSGDVQYTDAYRLAGVGRGVFEDMIERLEGVR